MQKLKSNLEKLATDPVIIYLVLCYSFSSQILMRPFRLENNAIQLIYFKLPMSN